MQFSRDGAVAVAGLDEVELAFVQLVEAEDAMID